MASADRDRPGAQLAGLRARILWADDNADMRDYVSHLLDGRFDVQAVADGQAALEAARANPPDLVLSDVMMPRLDGFGLLRELRADPRLSEVPIILLSARAGEESRLEGLEAGADDYLIKRVHYVILTEGSSHASEGPSFCRPRRRAQRCRCRWHSARPAYG